jgi:nucleoside-diphosphate-sugar epimerase
VLRRALDAARVVNGDLDVPRSLDDDALDEVTHVVHSAACTSFRSTRTVHRTNVDGTASLVERLHRAPKLERFVFVSTAYACGRAHDRIVRETDPISSRGDHVVEYARSKARAEELLAERFADLPVVVARPSAVIGHTRLGCAPSASLFWYYRALATLRRAPFAVDARRDIVSVDWVADALCTLLFARSLVHRVFHLSASESASATWSEIAHAFGSSDAPLLVARGDSLCNHDDIARAFGPGDVERIARAIGLCARFATAGVRWFDNARALDAGVSAPPPFTSYLDRCIATTAERSLHDLLVDDD